MDYSLFNLNDKPKGKTMTLRIEKTKNGKFFATVNGRRLTNTNYGRKWESLKNARNIIAHYGEEKLVSMIGV